MEIALCPEMPTYAGGLGVLAGDSVMAAADQGLPVLAVSLLHRSGCLHQRFDASVRQREEPVDWNVEGHLKKLPHRVNIAIDGRAVEVRA